MVNSLRLPLVDRRRDATNETRPTEPLRDGPGWPQGDNVPEEAYDAFWDDFRRRRDAHQGSPEHEAELVRSREEFEARIEGRDANAEFAIAFKALYLFMRAHQDSLCALTHLVQRPRGTAPDEYNMSTHLGREGGPVQAFIHAEVPEYEEWYWRWRDARNRVMTDHSEVIKLTDLIEAIEVSTHLHRAITRRAAETAEASATA